MKPKTPSTFEGIKTIPFSSRYYMEKAKNIFKELQEQDQIAYLNWLNYKIQLENVERIQSFKEEETTK